jgi:hypothetical protein
MELAALVKEAYEKDSTFKFKFDYWCHTRKKQPDLDWLMPLLENALGRDYVRQSAKAYIESQEASEG